MRKISFMHQNEMDLRLSKFSDAVEGLRGLSKKELAQTGVEKKVDKYIVIEPFEAACASVLKQRDAIDNGFRKYLRGRVHVEKELWIIASIKNLIDYGYLKIEE